ncbi:MAG TPA: transporter substrate-binding domain-containing protein [Stellaceae bacterium]|nr:transporter substrate-binding domain-containing protein [Stellaceae bacterium]
MAAIGIRGTRSAAHIAAAIPAFILLIAILIGPCPAGAQTLTTVASDWAPMSYLKNGQPAGHLTERVQKILKRAQLPIAIDIMPWERAFRTARSGPNIAIFPIGRTADREKQFIWIGELIPYKVFLWRHVDRRDITLKSVEDAARYTVGGVPTEMKAVYLEHHGITITPLVSGDNGLAMLARGRLDLVASDSLTLPDRARLLGIDPKVFVPILPLPELSYPVYLALSQGSDPALVDLLRSAFAAENPKTAVN